MMRRWICALALGSVTAVAIAAPKRAAVEADDHDAAPAAGAATKPIAQTRPTSKPSTKPAEVIADPFPAPPVPVLSADEMLGTFKLPAGLKIEVVASEPMIQHPVAMAWDADGRLFVVEMRAYMGDSYGKGEERPIGRVSMLEDTDGDGRMDKSTVFLDGLVMPRAVGLARDGVLVGAPPNLLFCRDTNGDGVSDEQTVVATDYGALTNPEHQPNGLMPAMDNWIYSAKYPKRLRYDAGKWVADPTTSRGQWGISQDDAGRLFHNSNSSQLHADLAPAAYYARNPQYGGSTGNSIAPDQKVFPAIPTIANRGYTNIVNAKGFLTSFTGACGPVIYRGGLLGKEYEGNAFLCEPVAAMVRRDVLTEDPDGKITARNPYEKGEFLTSTNERFRPVNAYTGPDGGLYVVDMHHGILQHRVFLTDFARKGYHQRDLDEHLGLGRIYRIVPAGTSAKDAPKPKMSKMTPAELIAQLASPNGWVRDTAQRVLVDRADPASVAPLRKFASSGGGAPLARVHALWALEGMRKLNVDTATAALADQDAKVRAAALRAGEQLIAKAETRQEIIPELLKLSADADPGVRLQFCFTAGNIGTPEAMQGIADVVSKSADGQLLRDAVITGLRGREDDFAQKLLARPDWEKPAAGRAQLLTGLAQCVFAAGKTKDISRLLDVAAAQSPQQKWRAVALLEGVSAAEKAKKLRKPSQAEAQPDGLAKLERSDDAQILKGAKLAAAQIVWPGKPGYKAPPPVKPLSAAEQQQFDAGKVVYTNICAACHQPDGEGQAGLAPPLVDSEYVLGHDKRLTRVVLNGLNGPVNVAGQTWNLEMPALKVLPDADVAAVLTYIRREWDHGASPVKLETVQKIKESVAGREQPFTMKELNEMKD